MILNHAKVKMRFTSLSQTFNLTLKTFALNLSLVYYNMKALGIK